MNVKTTDFTRLAAIVILLFLLVYFLIVARHLLIPLVFGGLLAIVLNPLCRKIEDRIQWRIPSIFLTFLLIGLPVLGFCYFIYIEITDVISSLPDIENRFKEITNEFYIWVYRQFGFTKAESEKWIMETFPQILNGSLTSTFPRMIASASFLINSLLTFVYCFFFMLYRTAFKNFFLIQMTEENREKAEALLERINLVIGRYLVGMLLVTFVLGVLNSLGLWIIGVKYCLFWGFLGGMLAFIPYLGTFLAAFLPFLYTLSLSNGWFQPLLVILVFNIVQLLENNLITPKIAGASVKLNPLASILSLLIWGSIWGIAGLVIAIPLMAIFKIIMEQVDVLRPISMLLGTEIGNKEGQLLQKFDHPRFRLSQFLRRK